MSGGIAYVLDEEEMFARLCNTAQVVLEQVLPAAEQANDGTRHRDSADEDLLKSLIEKHLAETGSQQARRILDDWAGFRTKFVKVFPNEYRRALKEIAARQLKEAA
jgi:glutamate synthase (NADPH/NADH) large chain